MGCFPPEGPWLPVPFHIPLRPRRSTWGMMGMTIRIGITNHEKCVFYHEKHWDSNRNKQEQCWKTYWKIIVNVRNIWAAVCADGVRKTPHWSTRDGISLGPTLNPFWLDDVHPLQRKGDHVVNMLTSDNMFGK